VCIKPFMFHETTLRPLGPSQGKAVVGGPEGEGGGSDGWRGGGGGLITGLITIGGSTAAPGTENAPGVDDAAGGDDEREVRASPVAVGGVVVAPKASTAAATEDKQEDNATAKSQ
jgi:hypothetical protein